ncbi:uncharacterized protein LOC126995010, partial [Eriocheir sinensis]|uniref:uncharacterized protein LOC126995010 n=1 Tax=Eriocheir sinensis TaxID=95602 RepID=UPI0021CA036B
MMDPQNHDTDIKLQLPRKRPRSDCIIHCSDGSCDILVSPKDLDSWNTLLRAAEIRQHSGILEIAKILEDGQVPEVLYHRKCRSLFTMKKALNAILSKSAKDTIVHPAEVSFRRSTRDAPSTSRVYESNCIFCSKFSKYLKGQKTREPLIQCAELRADDRIRNAATKKLDQKVLALLSRELVAAKGHYHKSCYKLYTKVESAVCSGTAKEQEHTKDAEYEDAERQACEELLLYIRNELFPSPEVLPMTDLASRFERSMIGRGISEIKPSTKKHLRRKLEREMGESLHFVPLETGKVLVYPDTMSRDRLVKQVYNMKKGLEDARVLNSGDMSKAAMQLRNQIVKQDVSQPWPNTDQNLEEFCVQAETVSLVTVQEADRDRQGQTGTQFGG